MQTATRISSFAIKIAKHTSELATVAKKCVCLCVSYKGDLCLNQLKQQLSTALRQTFNAAQLQVIAQSRPLPTPPIKAQLPVSTTSHCLHKFQCSCSCTYLGRTDRKLADRMNEHIPKWVRACVATQTHNDNGSSRVPASSIAKHLIETGHQVNLTNAFSVVLRCSKAKLLKFAEAVAINREQPCLCVHKRTLVDLRLPWG